MNDSHFTPFYNRSLNHPNLLSLLRIVSRPFPILLITNYVNKMQYMQAKPHKKMQGGVTHVMIVACPSLAFAFMLLLISHAIAFFVPVFFSIVIPTSFSIDGGGALGARAPPSCLGLGYCTSSLHLT